MNDELRRCRRFGWTSLAAWAAFGLAIEAAHGFKLSAYLDDDLRHTVLRLAHAHGVILALVVLAFGRDASPGEGSDRLGGRGVFPREPVAGQVGASQGPTADRRIGTSLRLAGLLIPAGFALGGIAPHEGDPGWPVFLVPIGGLFLVAGLVRLAWRSWRRG